MKSVILSALVITLYSTATAQRNSDYEKSFDDLKSAASRQKIYEIISSHENRKYGDHGGHEYEEGEVPRKSASRKYKQRYGYEPVVEGDNYYHFQHSKQPKVSYEPKVPAAEDLYRVPLTKAAYPAPTKEHYPVVETAYASPKKGYLSNEKPYVAPKSAYALPEADYVDPHAPKEPLYTENVDAYAEDKTAPITIGKTARTVFPKPVAHSYYPVADANGPSEYYVVDGQQPPRPLILDPKLKERYHHQQQQQPVAHYSAPEHQVVSKPVHYGAPAHQVVAKPAISVPVHYGAPEHQVVAKPAVPVHYAAPAEGHEQYDSRHKSEDLGHHAAGHGRYIDNAIKKESGHKSHGHHESAGHKAHSSAVGRHDEHDTHHSKGLYERDRGYHYEKAYAYDRVRSHHDVGSSKGAHSSYGAHQGHEAHKDAGDYGGETHSYYKKNDRGGGYGYSNGNSLHKKGDDHHYSQKYFPTYYHG